MEAIVDTKIKKLTNILKNLKKAPNRRYLKNTLEKKLSESYTLYNNLLDLLEYHENGEILLAAVRNTYSEIRNIINIKLDLNIHLINFKAVARATLFSIKLNHLRMANLLETIKVASSLIPTYDGNPTKLDATISALRALNTILTDATRPTAINVVLSKLEGKARSAVGDAPDTIDIIIQRLADRCKTTISSDVIVAKLNATRQSGTLSAFTDEVEKLTTQLETTYLAENIPIGTAGKMAVKAGIKALYNGIKNSQTQLILKAGTFETLNAAIGKAAENEPTTHNSDSANVFTTYNSNRGYRNSRGSYHPRGSQSSRGNFTYRGNNRYNNQNNNNQNGNNHFRNNQRGGYGNRGGHRPPRQANTYVAQQQQQQQPPPQQPQQQQNQQQQQQIPNQNHPLGVQFGQHAQ